jgi:hypothetical protein
MASLMLTMKPSEGMLASSAKGIAGEPEFKSFEILRFWQESS